VALQAGLRVEAIEAQKVTVAMRRVGLQGRASTRRQRIGRIDRAVTQAIVAIEWRTEYQFAFLDDVE